MDPRPLPPDAEPVLALMRTVAATELVPRFQQLEPGDVEQKGADDPVTVADRAAEAALISGLTALRPGAAILGEEGHASGTADWSALEAEACWVIDPLDGTRAFIAGRPGWGVLVAFVARGRVEAGWLLAPLSGRWAYAERGGGTWVDGALRSVSPDGPTGPAMLATWFLNDAERAGLAPLQQTDDLADSVGSCVIDYLRLLDGELGLLLYGRTLAWDHAVGVLLFQEAGGVHATFAGGPYDPRDPRSGLVLSRSAERVERYRQAVATPPAPAER